MFITHVKVPFAFEVLSFGPLLLSRREKQRAKRATGRMGFLDETDDGDNATDTPGKGARFIIWHAPRPNRGNHAGHFTFPLFIGRASLRGIHDGAV